ncbi:MAG: PD-(D/E)XK nuclease family transposase, partial [Patescibacteria group bacterium]
MKYILRDKANFDVLEGFLSALLDDDKIKILNILESEGTPSDDTEKFNRVDLLVEDSKHRKIIIEIQNTHESDYLERLLFGTSKVIVENQNLGKNFRNISKVISISILYFNLGKGDDYLYYGTTEFKGINTGTPLIVQQKVETTEHFTPKYFFTEKRIFPEYYLIKVEKYQNIVKRKIDEWIYAIKNQEVKPEFKSRNIDKAAKKLSELQMDRATRKRYEKFLINMAADRDVMETAKEKGREEGMKKG